ncbi:probable DNA-directed RNA polymerase subunit delta [Antennarius striatus]|uniref:probable DNA-directed RNA polymerase subunit delta n=1 Tax=Antennarius striatus TaxID=241820 RepID=UPI0035B265D0
MRTQNLLLVFAIVAHICVASPVRPNPKLENALAVENRAASCVEGGDIEEVVHAADEEVEDLDEVRNDINALLAAEESLKGLLKKDSFDECFENVEGEIADSDDSDKDAELKDLAVYQKYMENVDDIEDAIEELKGTEEEVKEAEIDLEDDLSRSPGSMHDLIMPGIPDIHKD